MKKLKFAFMLAFLLGAASTMSAEPQKVLVAPFGFDGPASAGGQTLINALQSALLQVNESIAIINNDETLNKLREVELNRQASGNVNDNELSRIGKEMAAGKVIAVIYDSKKKAIYAKAVDLERNITTAVTTFPDTMEDDPDLPRRLETKSLQALAPILVFRLNLYTNADKAVEAYSRGRSKIVLIKAEEGKIANPTSKSDVAYDDVKYEKKKKKNDTEIVGFVGGRIETHYGAPYIVFSGTASASELGAAQLLAGGAARAEFAQAIQTSVQSEMEQLSITDENYITQSVGLVHWITQAKNSYNWSQRCGDVNIINKETKKEKVNGKNKKITIYTVLVKVGMPIDKFEQTIESIGEQALSKAIEQNYPKEKIDIIINLNNNIKNYWHQRIETF